MLSSIAVAEPTEVHFLTPQQHNDYVLNFATNNEITMMVKGIGDGNIDCVVYTHIKTHAVDISSRNSCFLKISPWLKKYYLRIKNNSDKNNSYIILHQTSKLTNI
jgi:hypothetical protein